MALLSGYSFPVHLIVNDMMEDAADIVAPLAAFQQKLGVGNVRYTQGCPILEERRAGAPVFPGDVTDGSGLDRTSPVPQQLDLIPVSPAIAKRAAVAVE